jgi:hypothetical protein
MDRLPRGMGTTGLICICFAKLSSIDSGKVLLCSCLVPRAMGSRWQTPLLSDGNGGYSRKADP